MTFLQTGNKRKELRQAWNIGAYVRLSKEDGDKPESDSIQNQQRIIAGYVEHLAGQGEQIASTELYSDDGYAGGSFQRPAFQRLMGDIERGGINCVICKDLSRLGRNYPELGRLMEDYFPQKGVRVISVLNNLDSLRSPETYCSAIVSFSNIVNDDYIRQLSIKIKSTLDMKRRAGEFIGNYAPYGYVKSPADRHKLAVDPEAAEVVRMIFAWYGDGASASAIAKRLNAMGVLTPARYKARQGCKGFAGACGGPETGTWSAGGIASILRNEVYIGNLVQGKSKSVSYRSKKTAASGQEDWIVVEGVHEAIISDEQFTLVHDRLARRTRVPRERPEAYLLSGLVFCGSCGRRLHRCTANGYASFRCPTHVSAPERCQCPAVSERKLMRIALGAVQRQIAALVDVPAAIQAAERGRASPGGRDACADALRRAQGERQRLENARFRLYDSLQEGVIDREEYEGFRAQYRAELLAQEAAIRQLQGELEREEASRRADGAFAAFFQAHGNIPGLDRAAAALLLERIVVEDAGHIAVYLKCSPGRESV